jgi:hypothetical protein
MAALSFHLGSNSHSPALTHPIAKAKAMQVLPWIGHRLLVGLLSYTLYF